MMHYSEHKPLFGGSGAFLKHLMPWVMAPFYGIPIGMYRTHHILMHHKENNMFNKDLSSTEPYQRDSVLGFLHYWAMFWALLFTLPYWALKKRSFAVFAEVCIGCALWILLQVKLYQSGNGLYGFYQFQLPFFISSLALMFGNWGQHIFCHSLVANTKDLLSSYRYNCALTINVMNHFDNQVAFNDGYHITHHVLPVCHWTEMPLHFLMNLEKYAEHDPVVFDRCGFFDISLNLVIRQKFDPDGAWKWLIDRFVHFTPEKRSDAEVKAFLQERLKPIPERRIEKAPK